MDELEARYLMNHTIDSLNDDWTNKGIALFWLDLIKHLTENETNSFLKHINSAYQDKEALVDGLTKMVIDETLGFTGTPERR